jgi:hypothetical protein
LNIHQSTNIFRGNGQFSPDRAIVTATSHTFARFFRSIRGILAMFYALVALVVIVNPGETFWLQGEGSEASHHQGRQKHSVCLLHMSQSLRD